MTSKSLLKSVFLLLSAEISRGISYIHHLVLEFVFYKRNEWRRNRREFILQFNGDGGGGDFCRHRRRSEKPPGILSEEG